jgi:DNA-binding response OmpR family regulator
LGTGRILIVEDDADLAHMYSLGLARAGYEVQVATTAEEGRRLACEDPPKLVLLDIGLPDRSGLDILPEIVSCTEPGNTKIAMLTNLDEPQIKKRAEAGGAAGYFVKAETTPTVLRAALEGLLAG